MTNPFSDYRVSSGFGARTHPVTGEKGKMHNGVDFAIPGGTPLAAIGGGVVESVGYDDISGNYIRVKMPNGDVFSYAHMKEKSPLKKGQSISAGDVIGKVGSTGRSTGNHLHLTYKKQTKNGLINVDPLSILRG